MAEPVDWAGLMRVGLGRLRLAPEAFWAMTPGELWLALQGAGVFSPRGPVMGRGRLAELMAAFPDRGCGAAAGAAARDLAGPCGAGEGAALRSVSATVGCGAAGGPSAG